MSVEPTTAAWLKAKSDFVTAEAAPIAAAWGASATASEIASPFAERAAAQAEAGRQLAFFGLPVALDKLLVQGLRADLLGRLIDASADRGDLVGARCMVIGVEEKADVDMTLLTILRGLS